MTQPNLDPTIPPTAPDPVSAHKTSIDGAEVARFSAIAADWWNPTGKFKPLHRFNPVRLGYLRDRLNAFNSGDRRATKLLHDTCHGVMT